RTRLDQGASAAGSAGELQELVDWQQGVSRRGSEAALGHAAREVGGPGDPRSGAEAEGIDGVRAPRDAAGARSRALLPRRPGRPRSGERARRSARHREALDVQRRPGCDGDRRRRQGAAPAVGAGSDPERGFGEKTNPRRMGSGLVIRFDVVTLFPEMFAAITGSGITSRALEAGLYSVTTWNPRDFTADRYRTVDDRPYGGGPGMVMLAEPLERALDGIKLAGGGRVIYLSPQGKKLDHRRVLEFSKENGLTLLCGRYEGVDERLLERRVDEEVSIGDFVLSGGELAAMALIDAVVRQLPGALGDEASAVE